MASSGFGRMASMKQQPREYGLDSTLINPKNSNTRWIQQNLQEMEQHIKKLVKLMEDDVAKKSVTFNPKRPIFISLVQKCHQMYLSLADRYIKETRVGVHSNILSNHHSHVSTSIVPPGSKQLKRILSSKCRKSNHKTSDYSDGIPCNSVTNGADGSSTDDYSDTESDVDLHENDIVEMEFAPLNHETTIEEQEKTEESDPVEFRGLKFDSLSDNSTNDVSVEENLELQIAKLSKEDETEDQSLEEEQVVAEETETDNLPETEIQESIVLSTPENDIENSKISIFEEHMKELTITLEAATQTYNKLEENHVKLIGRYYGLQEVVICKVRRKFNRMKKDLLELHLESADMAVELSKEYEIQQSIVRIPENDIENSKISILEEHVKKLTMKLEAATQTYNKQQENHIELIFRYYGLQEVVSRKVRRRLNRMKKEIIVLHRENTDLTVELSKEDETKDLSLEEEQVVAGELETDNLPETEIQESIVLSIPENDMENSKISIFEEHMKELTIMLEAATQTYNELEENHVKLIERYCGLQEVVVYKVRRKFNRMKKDLLELHLENADLTAEIQRMLKMKEELRRVAEAESMYNTIGKDHGEMIEVSEINRMKKDIAELRLENADLTAEIERAHKMKEELRIVAETERRSNRIMRFGVFAGISFFFALFVSNRT